MTFKVQTLIGDLITLNPVTYSSSAGELEDVLYSLPDQEIARFARFAGEKLAKQVEKWDHEDVGELIQYVMYLDNILSRVNNLHTADFIDMYNLPTVKMGKTHISGENGKIWSMDRRGYALVGPSPDELEIEKIN